ncbi:hypothetical protein OI450_16050 [Pectobacterium cacticida]|uniref:Mobilization protein n=1 Tax=Pectobacterium cacticida TaxID=69221 RepID=A0ABZ2GE45_9GAMM|nr:hypothetical protein [Pectobacterium cacticida]UYX06410.1 hypothetical protein OI450_16050 [Pectobacterium cacticida]
MRVEEWKCRLDSALEALEQSIQRQQQEHRVLQQQLLQAKERDAYLCTQIERLSAQLSALDGSPAQNPLLQTIRVIYAQLDVLAHEAAAFKRSLR